MPQVELSAEEIAHIEQSRALKAKASQTAAYDISALEETELETTPPSTAGSGGVPVPLTPAKQHHPFIVEKARSFGFSDHDIESMSEESLIASVRGAEQYALRERNIANQRQDAAIVDRQRPAPPKPPVPEVNDEDEQIVQDLGIDRSKWDDDFVKIEIRKEKRRRKEMEELRGMVQQTQQVAQATKAQTDDQIVDGLFAAIGRREFGQGPSIELKGTPAWDRRVAVFSKTMQLGGLNEKNFRQAVEILYGKARQAADTNGNPPSVLAQGTPSAQTRSRKTAPAVPAAPTEEDFESGIIARPTNRRGAAEVKSDKKAESAIREKMRELGISEAEDFDDGPMDGFLPG